MSDARPLAVAVAGLGTVGAEVVRLVRAAADLHAQRCGRRLEVVGVSARDRTKDRGVDLGGIDWYDDAVTLARSAPAEVIIELIGGSDGVARAVCHEAIAQGRHLVTANKALLAHHGAELVWAAEAKGVALGYEAAVAGGIPAVKGMREGLAANRLDRVVGILNGTCNFILTGMRESGRDFATELATAKARGYAEADPTMDIDGIDAAHKLVLLAQLAFNGAIAFDSVHVEGIRGLATTDIGYAEELGYRIKLLGIAERMGEGVCLRVHPCMVPRDLPISTVEGVLNAVVAYGHEVGEVMMVGQGAGAGPTASAVVADLLDIARGCRVPPLGAPVQCLAPLTHVPIADRQGAYYLRLMVLDRPGVIAEIAAHMRDQGISLEGFIQRARSPDVAVPVVMTTHETTESAMQAALGEIAALPVVLEAPVLIRIETLNHQ
ncbi:MAG: homoserine dehydrogenase [Rhodospirillaceae bacterium]|nr:homoserine dehydrogenase [Rhodospirillaceae bacterium]